MHLIPRLIRDDSAWEVQRLGPRRAGTRVRLRTVSTFGVDQQVIGGHSVDLDGLHDGIGTDPSGWQRGPVRGVPNGNGATPSVNVFRTRDPQLLAG